MNILDLIIALIILIFATFSYKKGLIKTFFDVCGIFIALIIAKIFHPALRDFLLRTPLFDKIKEATISSNALQGGDVPLQEQSQMIYRIQAPDFVKDYLLENNNSEIYDFFGAESLADYIGSYVASLVLSVLSVIIIFILSYFLVKFLSKTLNLIGKLPVINTFNKGGGFLFGGIKAIMYIWVGFCILTLFINNENLKPVFDTLNNSKIALWLYENNLILNFITNLFT